MPAIMAALPGPPRTEAGVPGAPPRTIPAPAAFNAAAQRLDALSDPVRLRILWWLSQGERSVTALCELVGMRQQAVTHHLNILKLRRIVAFRRQERWNYYCLTDEGREVMAAAVNLIR